MRDDGLTAQQAKDQGYTAAQMLLGGYDLSENGGGLNDLRAGGVTATQASDILGIPSHAKKQGAHSNEAGLFKGDQLVKAGYTASEGASYGWSHFFSRVLRCSRIPEPTRASTTKTSRSRRST